MHNLLFDTDPLPDTYQQVYAGEIVNSDLEKAWKRQKTIEQRKYEALYEQMIESAAAKSFIKKTNDELKSLKWNNYAFNIKEFGPRENKRWYRWYIDVTFYSKLGKQKIIISKSTKLTCRLSRNTEINDGTIPINNHVRDWAVPFATSFFERKLKDRKSYKKTVIVSGGRGASKNESTKSFSDWLTARFDSGIEFARAKQSLSSSLEELLSSDKFNKDLKEQEKELAKKEMVVVFDRWSHLGNEIIYDAIKEFEIELVFS